MGIYKNLLNLAENFGLSSGEAEEFFRLLDREPSIEELAICGALWSEHCSYKSSKVHLKRFHTQEPWVLQGPGENAGVIAITENYGIAFKMESHNHPSYIEPFHGAATGVGGILRDVFCMGAMPIANLNALRFGEGSWNAHLLANTVKGIGNYGNSVGIPTVGGQTSFHSGYSQNILVNAFCAGIVHKNKIYKGILSDEKLKSENDIKISHHQIINKNLDENNELRKIIFPENENILIYFGSATGRDGVHGATMSSSEFSKQGASLKTTVQVGDPFAQKILLEATLELIDSHLTIGLQDMGAAGLTSSAVEMAERSCCGVVLNLNEIPKRASQMKPWEILLSESQERMLCAVEPENCEKVFEILKAKNLDYAIIGQVNRTGLFTCVFDEKIVTATPVTLLVQHAPKYEYELQDRNDYLKDHQEIMNCASSLKDKSENKPCTKSLNFNGHNKLAHEKILENKSLENLIEFFPNLILDLFSNPLFVSKKPLYQNFCSTVQGNTIAGCGALQSSSAAIVRLPRYAQNKIDDKYTEIGIALSVGCEERWVELNPFHGSALSVLVLARKIIASHGVPLAMTDCLNFGSPKSPMVMRQLSDVVDGINHVAQKLHIPIVSGNVSLNNQTQGLPIPPTPMLGLVGRVDDCSLVTLNVLPKKTFLKHSEIFMVHVALENCYEKSSYEASQVAWLLGEKISNCPEVYLEEEKNLWRLIHEIISQLKPLLCFPVGHGGLISSLISCALNSNAQLTLQDEIWKTSAKKLFSEGNMGFVFGVSSLLDLEQILKMQSQDLVQNFTIQHCGSLVSNVTKESKLLFEYKIIKKSYEERLERFF